MYTGLHVLHAIKEVRNILQTIKTKDNWIGHIWHRNSLLKHITEGKIQRKIGMTRRQGRRHTKLWDDFKKRKTHE
jgi:hypothetical protein